MTDLSKTVSSAMRDVIAMPIPAVTRRVAVGTIGTLLFTGLTIVGARIEIPLQPVPITLQTMFVLLAGAVLGRRLGALSQGMYLALGAAGLPVYAGSAAGFSVLAGPTGGYLIGFCIAPVFVALLIGRYRSAAWQYFVVFAGSLVILGLGVLHLSLFFAHDVGAALTAGLLPFIPGDLLKVAAVVAIYRSYSALRTQRARG
jgi:biotin transport system substrate-specific component